MVLKLTCIVYFYWRRQWHPTAVLLPGKSHGWRSLIGCSQPGAVVDRAHVTDEAPTLAAVLGQTMPQADGRVLHELLV